MNLISASIKIFFGITVIIFLGAFSMFPTHRNELSKDWQERFNNTELFNEFTENNNIVIKNSNINGARIPGSKAKNFLFENVNFIDFGGKESTWQDGSFIDSEFNDFSFYNAHLKNITFKNSTFIDAHFSKAKLENVKFINCKITKSAFFNMEESSVEFIDSEIYDNDYKFSESHIQLRLINSEVTNTKFMLLKSGSSVYIENSKITEVTFAQSKLNLLKIIKSEILKTGASDSEINNVFVDDSKINLPLLDAIINTIIVTNSEILNLGTVNMKVDSIAISDCKEQGVVSFYGSKINNIKITNCDFEKLYPMRFTADSFSIEDSTISNADFAEAHIKNLSMKNITFTREADFTDFKADNATLENITKGSKLKLIMDGANIEF